MSWAEAWRLFMILRDDPSSQVGTALAGYDYPFTRESAILADTFDLVLEINRDHKRPQPKPYPRPWPIDGSTRVGKTNLTPDEARQVLATQFGKPEPTPQDAPAPEDAPPTTEED